MAQPSRLGGLGLTLVCPLVLGLGLCRDARLLFSYPVAVGIDGYYYVIQVESFSRSGRLFFRTLTPLIPILIGVFNLPFQNPVIAIKIFALLLQGLICLSVFAAIRTATNTRLSALLGLFLIFIPTSHLFLLAEFLKTLGALSFLLLAFWFFLTSGKARNNSRTIITLTIIVLACASHLLAVVIVSSGIGMFYLTVKSLKSTYPSLRLGALIVITWLVTMLFLLLANELAVVSRFVSVVPQDPFQSPVIPEELLLLAVSSAVIFITVRQTKSAEPFLPLQLVFCTVAVWSLAFTFNPFLLAAEGLSGLGGRLRVLAFLQNAVLLPYLLHQIWLLRREVSLYICVVALPLLLLSYWAELPFGLRPQTLERRSVLIQGLAQTSHKIDKSATVIAPHGDQFVVTASLGVSSRQRISETVSPIYWLLETRSGFSDARAIVLFSDSMNTIFLIEDGSLRDRMKTMPSAESHALLQSNPILVQNGVR